MNYPLAFLSVVLAAITASCMTSPDVGQSSPTPVTHPADAPAAITTPEFDTSSASSDSAEAAGLSISTSEEISVRSGPGVTFGIVGRLKPGRSYAVTGRGYEWLEVLLDHGTGWVFSPLVTLEGDLDAIPFMTPSPPPGALETTTFQYQEAAIACIGNLLGQSDLRLNFLEHTLMINSPNADVRVAVFEDPLGTRFSVDPATCTLVQIEPRGPRYSPGSPVSLDVLRQMALDLASRSPGFLELKPTLTYEEGEKDGLHFFTWSDMHREWKFNRPQLQVGLWEDGSLSTYMNTLIYTASPSPTLSPHPLSDDAIYMEIEDVACPGSRTLVQVLVEVDRGYFGALDTIPPPGAMLVDAQLTDEQGHFYPIDAQWGDPHSFDETTGRLQFHHTVAFSEVACGVDELTFTALVELRGIPSGDLFRLDLNGRGLGDTWQPADAINLAGMMIQVDQVEITTAASIEDGSSVEQPSLAFRIGPVQERGLHLICLEFLWVSPEVDTGQMGRGCSFKPSLTTYSIYGGPLKQFRADSPSPWTEIEFSVFGSVRFQKPRTLTWTPD